MSDQAKKKDKLSSDSAQSKDVAQAPRRQGMKNFLLAIKHINEASVADNVKQRFSDYVTIALVVLCIISLVVAVSVQVPPAIRLLPLLFTVGAVLFYIINRMGIIISLTPRQALIVWQILVAGFWLGVTSAMVVMLGSMYYFAQAGAS